MENALCPDKNAPIFEELRLNCLTVKNRLFRSSISGRIDNYNGSGTPARVKFEELFAQGGVGAIISSHVPIRIDSRVLPNYATIDCDERIPFWKKSAGGYMHTNVNTFCNSPWQSVKGVWFSRGAKRT